MSAMIANSSGTNAESTISSQFKKHCAQFEIRDTRNIRSLVTALDSDAQYFARSTQARYIFTYRLNTSTTDYRRDTGQKLVPILNFGLTSNSCGTTFLERNYPTLSGLMEICLQRTYTLKNQNKIKTKNLLQKTTGHSALLLQNLQETL
jgi:hypothetical protein